uniref:Uncharacterized protein n=1 Tax=Anguilla anguilla TaxID=7936 RepID=A0A0E9URT0_ANGAN
MSRGHRMISKSTFNQKNAYTVQLITNGSGSSRCTK